MSDCQVSLLVQPSGMRISGDVEEKPPLPSNIDEILASPCPFWPNKKINETHMLVLIPTKVDGKSFTLENLLNLVTNPKSGGHVAQCNFDWGWLQYINHGKQPVKASYWVMMTKDVLPETRRKPFGDQVKLFKNKKTKSISFGGKKGGVPTALEAATCLLMEHLITGIKVYGEKEQTLTRCIEEQPGGHPLGARPLIGWGKTSL